MLRRVFMCKRIEEEVYKPVIGIAINLGIMKPDGSTTPTFLTPSRGYSFRSFLRPPRRPRARPPPLCEICQLLMALGKAACTRLEVIRSAGAYMAFRNDFIKCAIHCADVVRKSRVERKAQVIVVVKTSRSKLLLLISCCVFSSIMSEWCHGKKSLKNLAKSSPTQSKCPLAWKSPR